MQLRRVKGCYDIYPGSKELWQCPYLWQYLEKSLRETAFYYGCEEIVTPSFEYTEVFQRTSGQQSDIVSKEMYTFLDKKGRSISLKPELTAPVIRSYIENSGFEKKLTKLFYLDSCYRYDRPQKGRYRQFRQFGVEILGQKNPLIDVETIAMLSAIYENIGIKNTTLLINSIGSRESRDLYIKKLKEYLHDFENNLSYDSQQRLQKNPIRILDSKDSGDKKIIANAPAIFDFLANEEKDHFYCVTEGLSELNISYKIDPLLVRGLDYYTDTVFELIRENDVSGQNTLAAGGVYQGLVKQLGGKDIPGIGFAIGLERTIQMLLDNQISIAKPNHTTFFCIGLTQEAKKLLLKFAIPLRKMKKKVEIFEGTSIKSGLKKASENQYQFAIILGEEELQSNSCKIKDLASREEETIELQNLFEWTKNNTAYHQKN